MIRVMIVDDSPLVRKIAGDILAKDPEIEVVATAATAEFALAKLEREHPDVITMDMEMPRIGGVEAIRSIMTRRPTPVLVLSAHARRGADLTLQALEAGAVDFVLKPSASLSGGLDAVARELTEKVKAAAGAPMPSAPSAPRPALEPLPIAAGPAHEALVSSRPGCDGDFEVIAIGTSTGGPVALKEVLAALPAEFPIPIVVVQHMPPVFTRAFSERLNSICKIAVKEAEDGDEMIPGRVLIAPGDYHMAVLRTTARPHVLLHQRGPVSGHRPSVDVLMLSVAREYGERAAGVIMTGMGRDGADGIHELRRRGGFIVSQDKSTSVIFGMNREVILNGDADAILPLDKIAPFLVRCVAFGVSA